MAFNKDMLTIEKGCANSLGVTSNGVASNSEYTEFTCEIPVKGEVCLNIFDEKKVNIISVCMNDYKVNSHLASVRIKGIDNEIISYNYENDGNVYIDEFAKANNYARTFTDTNIEEKYANIYASDFDWSEDCDLAIPFDEVISYQLHVRGFTRHSSSKVKNKGSFPGIIEKIDYLKNLGINQIILMPAYEFDEIDRPDIRKASDILEKGIVDTSEERINYWGFKKGYYYMPNSAYAVKNPVKEFKQMVLELHKAGIEVIMRFYFPDEVRKIQICDVLRFWAREYHVDGFCLMGTKLPVDMICQDLYLADNKIYFYGVNADSLPNDNCNSNIAVINEEFMNVSRRFLKSDENMLSDFLRCQRNNPEIVHSINCITDFAGFTLNDLVSYEHKHNEDNKEENRDGNDYNFSWNCGIEGPTKKKAICELRIKQIKNALSFLILAQATPLLLAGDEFMNSQSGNNNPYCQDNEIGWLNWKRTKYSDEIYEFTKMLIALRKNHPVLHPANQFKIMDYISCGFPDLSYHSYEAWSPKFDGYRRNIGLMLCGKYYHLDDGKEDDFFFFAYNMHWDKHDFALPKLPKGLKWDLCISSSNNDELVKLQLETGHVERITILERTVVILKSVPV